MTQKKYRCYCGKDKRYEWIGQVCLILWFIGWAIIFIYPLYAIIAIPAFYLMIYFGHDSGTDGAGAY